MEQHDNTNAYRNFSDPCAGFLLQPEVVQAEAGCLVSKPHGDGALGRDRKDHEIKDQ